MTTPLLRLTTSKIRRMSRRRRKIAVQRRMSAYLRARLADLVSKPTVSIDEVVRRTAAALDDLVPPPLVVTSARMEGDVMIVDSTFTSPASSVFVRRGPAPLPRSASECQFGDEEYQWRLSQAGL